MTLFFYVVSIECYFIQCYAAIFLHDGFNCCIGLSCHYSVYLTGSRRVCYRTNAVHELPSPLVHLLHWQTCITVLNFHSSMNFDGFHPFITSKNGWQNAVLLWWMLQAGPQYLHYYCAVLLHSCIVVPSAGHASNHEYRCCQLTRQSSRVSNFYRTFKVFIWLSLECTVYRSFATTVSQLKMCDVSGETFKGFEVLGGK